MGREQVAELAELRKQVQIVTDVMERSGYVLNVYGIAAGGCLVTEGAERLQVALQRHQIEPVTEFVFLARLTFQREKVREQLVDGLVGQVDI